MYSTLIAATDLAKHLLQENWVVVDCRFDLAQPSAGHTAYLAAHIPGAVYADLESDLSSPRTASSGRHPLPEPARLAERLGAWGIAQQTQVVAYDADNGALAARLWWLLRWLGHEHVAVLDGGFKHWLLGNNPVSGDIPRPQRKNFQINLRPNVAVDAQQLVRQLQQADWRVLDARAPERYAGTVEPLDPVGGHVPGAHNYSFARNLDATGRFLPPAQLREQFNQALNRIPGDHVIAMCGSGVTACHNLLAMEVAGLRGGLLYPGSWSEWIRDPARPIATGTQP